MTIPHPTLSTAAYREHMDRAKTEKQFTAEVLALAKRLGWCTAHFRTSLNVRGKWQTAVQGDGAGFPDLVLVRERVVFAELKTETGRLSEKQVGWIAILGQAKQETYVWRPRDWSAIEGVLLRNVPRMTAEWGSVR